MSNYRVVSSGGGAIAVCDRCKQKYRYLDLRPDGAMPGLQVCPTCYDNPNPWVNWQPRLAPLTLKNPRPDQVVVTEYIRVVDGRPTIYLVGGQGQKGLMQSAPQPNGAYVQVNRDPHIQKDFKEKFNQYIPPSVLTGNYANEHDDD